MKIKELLDLVAKEKASDLFITAGAPPLLRVDGELLRTKYDTLTPEQAKELIYGFLNKEQQDVFEAAKELDFSLALGRKHRFRVNVYLQKGAVTAALRPIPENVPSLAELGLPDEVGELAKVKQGLVLVTGPTGHGKTTTLASMINLINNTRACHINTIEDRGADAMAVNEIKPLKGKLAASEATLQRFQTFVGYREQDFPVIEQSIRIAGALPATLPGYVSFLENQLALTAS